MSYHLTMTDEQAKWLAEHLDKVLDDHHWLPSERKPPDDDREHAETIKRKIDEETKRRQW